MAELLVAFLICFLINPALFDVITVPDGAGNLLEHYLCEREGQRKLTPDTSLVLNSEVTHGVAQGHHCILDNLRNITIKSSGPGLARIVCNATTETGNQGTFTNFAFLNSINITLAGLSFINCGASLHSILLDTDNHTHLQSYFATNQSAVLYISHVYNLTLFDINIYHYYGLAIAIVNAFGVATLSRLNVSQSRTHELCDKLAPASYTCYGTGLLIYTHNNCSTITTECSSPSMSNNTNTLMISDSIFVDNYNFNSDFLCIFNVFQFRTKVALVSAPAVSVFTTQTTFKVNVFVSNSTIANNSGSLSGGMLFVFINTPYSSQLMLSNVNITNNKMVHFPCVGTGLVTYIYFTDAYMENASHQFTLRQLSKPWVPFTFANSTVSRHHEDSSTSMRRSSTVYIAMKTQYLFDVQVVVDRVTFVNNSATYTGICLNAETPYEPIPHGKKLVVWLKDIIAMNNSQSNAKVVLQTNSSQFVFYRIERVYIEGRTPFVSRFSKNWGSVIDAFSTDVYLSGSVEFSHNRASQGPAILLRSGSHLILAENTSLLFEGNTASLYGGAIYAVDQGTENNFCAIQVDSSKRNLTNLINVTFIDNLAYFAGNSMYIRPYTHCFQSRVPVFPRQLNKLYSSIFKFPGSSMFNQTASLPSSICRCIDQNVTCGQHFPNVSIYPGETITLQMIAQDENGKSVVSLVNSSFTTSRLSLGQGQSLNTLYKHSCRNLSFTVYSNGENVTSGKLSFGVPGYPSYTHVHIYLKKCPPGFQLQDGICKCNNFVRAAEKELFCNETDKTIQVNENGWIGVLRNNLNNETYIGYSIYCPHSYCISSSFDTPKITTSEDNANSCVNNRDGPLCGNCKDGYSSVQGGYQCEVCTDNNGLFWLIGNFATGIIAVLLMFVFKLTLEHGTIGGVVFYANAFNVINTIPASKIFMLPFVQFIQVINLNQVFPTCFFIGMHYSFNIFHKYLFSVYLWLIAIIIILIARCSSTVARLIMGSSVQVLMTFIHLTFARTLSASIEVFVFTNINTEHYTYTAWLYNGTIQYATGVHVPLLAIGVFFVTTFIIPYVLLATFGPFCLKFSIFNKFRPFFDTLYGPYKDKYRYWFGIRLILLVILALLTAGLRGSANFYQYIWQLTLLIMFMFIQAYVKPFKYTWANHLDNWCMVNVILLTIINLYNSHKRHKHETLLAGLLPIIITALVIIGYHIMMFARKVKQTCSTTNYCCLHSSIRGSEQRTGYHVTTWIPRPRLLRSDYQSVECSTDSSKTLREPLLDYIDTD